MMSNLAYLRPDSTEVVSSLLQQSGARPIAGATDLLVQMHAERVEPSALVDLNALPALSEISVSSDGALTIGAIVRLSRLSTDPLCRAYPALIEAAETVGSIQIRNRATLVGNICNASPAADTAPALLVYDARVNIAGPDGRRSLEIREFWRGPGSTVLGQGEWVESITLPPPGEHGGCYEKLGRTMGVDLAVVGVAAVATQEQVRIGLASVAPTPVRASAVEALYASSPRPPDDALREAIQKSIRPISDLRSSAEYRRAMTEVLVRRAVNRARAQVAGEPERREGSQ